MAILTFSILLGFIFHLVGDYITQNNWMALNKTKSFFPAIIHATIYSLPFLILVPGYYWLVIWGTHVLIDRYRLAQYWIKLVNWNWKSTNYGYKDDTPIWLSTWLLFIVDNIFHILINTSMIILYHSL